MIVEMEMRKVFCGKGIGEGSKRGKIVKCAGGEFIDVTHLV